MDGFTREAPGALRVLLEDALKHAFDCEESGRSATVDSLAGAMGKSRKEAATTLGELRARGLLVAAGDAHQLSEAGRKYALQVVRNHRIFETWLMRQTGKPAVDWHREAHREEHRLEADEVNAMADRMNNPRYDPHGDPIPTREGIMPKRPLPSLAAWADGVPARIGHIEDEPEDLFRLAGALGLAPGTRMDAIAHEADGSVSAKVEGREVVIPAAAVGLIHLIGIDAGDELPVGLGRLSDLHVGDEAIVHGLAPSCVGPERTRLLDLGVVPGTKIRCEFSSPFGSPKSYLIRGAMIGLRESQAKRILILRPTEVSSSQKA
ncbi:MAG: DtxR family transcriptional regulator [Luteolibacter sp.]